MNPINEIMVTLFLLSAFSKLSGIISLIITYNIALAANSNENGRIFLLININTDPNIPNIGSTIALMLPIKKALNVFVLFFFKGRLIASPSGKFCIPIARANNAAAINVSTDGLYFNIPNAIPTDKPSGML